MFATPWTAARQASLSITSSQSLLKRMSIELVMTSNHLIPCHPLLHPTSIFPSIRVFSNESVHCNLEGNGWMNKCSLFLSVLLPVPLIGWCLTESRVQGSLLYSPYSVFKNWRRIESRSGEKLKISKIYSHLFKFSLLHLNKQLSYRKYLHSLCLIYS